MPAHGNDQYKEVTIEATHSHSIHFDFIDYIVVTINPQLITNND